MGENQETSRLSPIFPVGNGRSGFDGVTFDHYLFICVISLIIECGNVAARADIRRIQGMRKLIIDTCKLCRRENQQLKESHLMPAGLYRRLLSSDKNPHPILVTKDGSRSSSDQITDNVFCAECEGRLDQLGENYTLRYAANKRRFRLLEELESITPALTKKEWRGYKAADTPQIKRDDLAYFALSVFWRAAIHSWPDANGTGRKDILSLGGENTEGLRRFLMGEGPMPSTMVLFFVVLTDRLSQASFYTPNLSHKRDFRWFYGFSACGFMFQLTVGKNLDYQNTAICFVRSPERWIWVRDGEAKTLQAFGSLLAKQPPEVRGK